MGMHVALERRESLLCEDRSQFSVSAAAVALRRASTYLEVDSSSS